jgi:hypothetical protein
MRDTAGRGAYFDVIFRVATSSFGFALRKRNEEPIRLTRERKRSAAPARRFDSAHLVRIVALPSCKQFVSRDQVQ